MTKCGVRLAAVAALSLGGFPGVGHAQVNVTTYHNDNSRTGQNTQETILTPANVNSSQFGKLFSDTVDGKVYAQPLYLAGVSIGGGTHNVLYVATEHDSLYAIDADSGVVYWQLSLIPAGGTTVNSISDLSCTDLTPEIGITGTPVIDPSTGTLYVVAKSKVGGVIQQSLHAIDVSLATEKFGGPVKIQASVAGTAADGNGSTVSFSPMMQHQRPALLLENGHLIIGWGSHCDNGPWHGWIMSYSASTLTQEAVFNTSPNGIGSGVWMSGSGIAADSNGSLYVATGNGTWDGTADWGDSILKLGPPSGGTFPVLDYFTTYYQLYLADNDLDVGSGGLVLVPNLTNGDQLLALMAKIGVMYVVNRNNMGKYCVNQSPACTNSDPQIVDEIPNSSVGVWGAPAYWNGNLYWGGGNDNTGVAGPIAAFSITANGTGATVNKTSQTAHSFGFSAPTPSISANGTTNAILWGLDDSAWNSTCSGTKNCQVLYAYDATNLGNLLYTSSQAANGRDVPGGANKFVTPTITNGKVYVGSQATVSAFGLLGSTAPVSTSSVSLAAAANVEAIGNNGSAVTNGGIDGNGYTYSSTLLGTSATWSGVSFTLGGGGATDAVSSTTVSLPAGSYSTLYMLATGVNGNQTNQKFVVTYTDGTTTTITQSLSDWYTPQAYGGEAIALTEAYRLTPSGGTDNRTFYIYGYALAINSAKTVASLTLPKNRNVVVLSLNLLPSGSVTPTAATPTFNPQPGSFSSAQSVLLSDSTPGAVIYYTTNGVAPTTGSTVYSGAIPVSATTTIEAMATASGYTASGVASGTYTISTGTSTVTSVSLAAAANVQAIGINGSTVTNGGVDTNGYTYSSTLLGTSATWSGVNFTLGAAGALDAVSSTTVSLPAGSYSTLYLLAAGFNGNQTNQKFVVTYTDGTTTTITQSLSDWYTPQSYAGESIALTEAYRLTPSGATDNRPFYIYGYALGINSAKTVASLALPNNRNVVVLAVTAVPSGTPTAATPTFNPQPGSFSSAQSVLLSDTTPGAVIYYTTNGVAPTTGSAVYSGAIPVSATTTIEAMATASGYTASGVASGTYSISTGTSTVTSVSLAAAANVQAIGINGSAVTNGGIDTYDYTYSSTLLGTSATWSGVNFTLGGAGVLDAVSSTTVSLPAGSYSTLYLLATGVNGDQTNQTFVVTYTDGTNTTITQSFSDWYTPQSFAGESIALTEAYRLTSSGATDNRTFYVYGYALAINGAKTVASLTLPNNRNVVVLAATLHP